MAVPGQSGWNVDIQGIAKTIDFLERFDKETAKVLKRDIKSGANEVAKESRSLIPNDGLRNWGAWTYSRDGRDLGFIGTWVKRGIVTETQRTRNSGITIGFGYRVVTKTAAGAIYELAGSRSSEPMPRAMENKRPVNRYPRTLFAAYYAAMPTVQEKVAAAIAKLEREASN